MSGTSLSTRKHVQRALVALLNNACRAVDEVLYRPAFVKVGMPLPRWWNCELARLSVRLDDRWQTEYWDTDWWHPGKVCDVCGRRASWLTTRDDDKDDLDDTEPSERDFPDLDTCFWCQVLPRAPITSRSEWDAAVEDARRRSVSWRWKWTVVGAE
ncbi:MAG TPA: hypothetical protein VID47_06065 [Actinomycetota bacterium]|jgi:hypothetical protein